MSRLLPLVISFEILSLRDPHREVDVMALTPEARDIFVAASTSILEVIDSLTIYEFKIACIKYDKDSINYYMTARQVREFSTRHTDNLSTALEIAGTDLHRLEFDSAHNRHVVSGGEQYQFKRIRLFEFKC